MEEVKLQKLLQEVSALREPNREKNIFSIGGRGHYENPTSDLLGFYLDPNGEHGLGDLVLSCLIECLPDPKPSRLGLEEQPEREYVTSALNRVDLILNGVEWVIALENKLEHGPNNPFEEYYASIERDSRFAGKEKYFVILAPYNPKVTQWTWIDWRLLVGKLRDKVGSQFVTYGISKWVILLREFLINIEEQLGTAMDDRQFKFVRDNYSTVVEAIELHNRYIDRVKEKIQEAAKETLGTDQRVAIHDWKENGKALRVWPWQNQDHNATLLVLPNGKFRIQFYVRENMKRPEIDRSYFNREGMFPTHWDEAGGKFWVFAKDEESLESALATLQVAFSLLKAATL